MSNDLAVKYRPQELSDVVGQDHMMPGLKALITKRNSHAGLFHGPSGCGKTTLARILAHGLDAGKNITEVDAARNTGIDAMRQVADNAQYNAFGGGNRAVIVDEAHGLSKQAWNSLLKAIEEPPKHLFWFFCTTEPAKVPQVIRTRCSLFEVKLVHKTTC